MEKLRASAEQSQRKRERLATLDRMKQACDAIADGKATSLIEKYLPEAKQHYRRRYTLIRPDRIEEYVRARRTEDGEARRLPSAWTGPTAVTLRKDKSLLQYVKTRADEQEAGREGGKSNSASLEAALATVPDAHDRAYLRLAAGRAEELRTRATNLEKVLREIEPLRATLLLVPDREKTTHPVATDETLALPASAGAKTESKKGDGRLAQRDIGIVAVVLAKLMDECEGFPMVRFGLEYERSSDRVILRNLRHELVSPDEMAALRRIASQS